MPSEAGVQRVLLASETLAQAVNVFYATAHYAVTAAFLMWMYLRWPGPYGWARNTLILLTGAALVLHLVVPLAPPRLLPEFGLVDTGVRYGPSVYGPPQDDTLNNQYAAMPSLHVGWALVVVVGLLATTGGWWRWLWLAYPAAVLLTVVGTAHHFWLDGVVAAVLLGAILLMLRRAHSLGALSNTEDAQVAA